MTSSFERHGIDHLSASSINLFVAEPAMWAMQKLMGRKSGVGAAAHRGTSIEAGVEMGLFEPDAPVEACQELAIARFNQLSESAFGRLAVNDWKLLRQLRAGRRMWPDTEDRVRGFMVTYQPKTRSEVGQ